MMFKIRMNIVAVPPVRIPPAIGYMMKLRAGNIMARTIFAKLTSCSLVTTSCEDCRWQTTCRALFDNLVESPRLKNWKGVERNVARYYE